MESLRLFIEYSYGDIIQEIEAQGGNIPDVQIYEVPFDLEGLGCHTATSSGSDMNEVAKSCMTAKPTTNDDLSVAPMEQDLPRNGLPVCYRCFIYNIHCFTMLQSLCGNCKAHVRGKQFWEMVKQTTCLGPVQLSCPEAGGCPLCRPSFPEMTIEKNLDVLAPPYEDGELEEENEDVLYRARMIRADIQAELESLHGDNDLQEGSLC